MSSQLIVKPDLSSLLETLATKLAEVAAESIAARGRFSLALSGGSTPKAFYQLLATPAWKDRFEWDKCDIFFGDDRAVPPTDALSNFKMASEALLDAIPARVHRMQGERTDLEAAALDYEAQLRQTGYPIDVILLGLGDDGHTASLFPLSPQLNAAGKWVTATPVASLEPHVRRLTFTFEAINEGRHIWFLVTGAGKAPRLQEVLQGPRDVEWLPAQGVAPEPGELLWFLDEAAAKLVSS